MSLSNNFENGVTNMDRNIKILIAEENNESAKVP